ncbi:hypothetical protein TNCV_4114821 [Trichonephila clavipes]|nr:hypothetical protein TNCV_4114821 [Trichonephila clavipes]
MEGWVFTQNSLPKACLKNKITNIRKCLWAYRLLRTLNPVSGKSLLDEAAKLEYHAEGVLHGAIERVAAGQWLGFKAWNLAFDMCFGEWSPAKRESSYWSKKKDLRRIASELELCVSDKLTVLDFMDLIKNCDRYKNDPDSVHELANLIIEERKYDESQQLELEKIREKSKLDLEIARIRANDKDNNTEVNCNDSFSVDSLIKSIRTLTVKIPDKPEGWSFFFLSLERAFAAKVLLINLSLRFC